MCLITFTTFIFIYKLYYFFQNKRYSTKTKKIKLTPFIVVCALPFSAFFSVILSYLYSDNCNILIKIDNLLSNRLSIGNETFNNFSIKLFGQHIEMNGNGGFSIPWYNYEAVSKSGYNFIDSSYLSILFRYGLFVFICVMVLFTVTSFVARKHCDYIALIIIAIFAVHSIMEHHLLDFNYNPFMFLLISSYYGKHISKNKPNKSDITKSETLSQGDLDTTIDKEVQA